MIHTSVRVPAALRPALADDRLARAAWSRLAEPGDVAAASLVAEVGAVAALEVVLTRGGRERWVSRLQEVDPTADLAAVAVCGGRLVVPGDEEWPTSVDDLARSTARGDDSEGDGGDRPMGAPLCLWVRGPASLATVSTHSVALVGSRAATAYGQHLGTEIACGLAERDIAVVSGGAFGIDAAAHQGALVGDGLTVAVLPGGVDRPYPLGNASLLRQIAQTGALVSELPPGSVPTRWRALGRQRLTAALSGATVVVEAA